jgi:TonB family protein
VTLWLSNIAAFSLQLAVLVGTAAALVRLLRIDAAVASQRFWQVVLVVSLLWPTCQLLASLAGSSTTPVLSAGTLWFASTGVGEIHASIVDVSWALAAVLLAVLGGGATLRLVSVGLGLIRLRRIRSESQPALALAPLIGSLQKELGVCAEVAFSDAVDGPATIGARHPIVLLPHRVGDLADDVQRAVLCHELIHVRRRDWLPTLGEELWCAALWFHPAARVLASRLTLAREAIVDAATIAHTRDRRAYAAALLEFAAARPPLIGAAPLIRRRHLEQRIALLTREVPMPRYALICRLTLAAATVAVATLAASSTAPLSATLHAQTERVHDPRQDSTIVPPQVVSEVKPVYTPEAMQAKIQGSVWMEVVVLANGGVGDVTIVKSLDSEHGLDQQALAAVRQWMFRPGTKSGKAVPVLVTIEMTFTLRSRGRG